MINRNLLKNKNINLIWKTFLLFTLFFAFKNPLTWLFNSWVQNPYYQHGFLVVCVSLLLFIFKYRQSKTLRKNNILPLIIISIASYAIGFYMKNNFLVTMAFFPLLLTYCHFFLGKINLKSISFPILYPIAAIPFPYLPEITAFLQFFAVKKAVSILQFFSLPVEASGVNIYLPEAHFIVGAPSSGIQSFLILPTLTLLLCYFTKTTTIKKVSLTLLSFPVSILGNVLRITLVLLVGYVYGENAANTFWHHFGNSLYFIFILLIMAGIWYSITKKRH
jgi:exosortase